MSKGLSLHIGVNHCNPDHYGGWSGPLDACEADAQVMHQLAVNAGFQATLVETVSATREFVGGFIDTAAAQSEAGDIVMITYAGHGGQVEDIDGDEIDDIDETWCLYNGQLLDDELSIYWSKFAPGVRVLLISDSCHSGTVAKSTAGHKSALGRRSKLFAKVDPITPGRRRFMPRDVAIATQRSHWDFYDDIQRQLPRPRPPILASVRLLSGCQDDQYSTELGGHGVFTTHLLQAWDEGRFEGNYAQFHQGIIANMPTEQQPNHLLLGEQSLAFDAEKPFTI